MQTLSSPLRRRGARAALGVAVAGLAVGTSIIGGGSANADPKQFSALVGYGSDTTQDIMNALAGNSNNVSYTPIASSIATGAKQITSWDAFGSTCITPKAGGASITRAAGSTQGRRALSRAIDGGNFGTAACGGAADGTGKPVSGMVDYARSSSGPSGAGAELTYIPMGLDAMSFAYYRNGGGAVTSLTRQDIIDIYTNGSKTIGTVRIVPCGIQNGSGTKEFWQKSPLANMSDADEDTATAECNAATTTALPENRIEENNPNSLKLKGDSTAMTNSALCPAANPCQVIVGMSAGSFIAQTNGVSPDNTAVGVDLGAITDSQAPAPDPTNIGIPYDVLPSGDLVPDAVFFDDPIFGRSVYVVVDTARATGFGNADLKSLFVGAGSALCSADAQTTVNKFGFLTPPDCGSTTKTGPLIAGNI